MNRCRLSAVATEWGTAAPPLSVRQAEIAEMIVSGKSSREIAKLLFLSPRTVENHIAALFAKLRVGSRVEVVTALLSSGGVDSDSSGVRASITNLPSQRTSLLGRETAIAEIVDIFLASRLVTITGAGGVGKTRIALAVGNALAQEKKSVVRFVELAQISRGSLVPSAVAEALRVTASANRSPLETLLAYCRQKSLLLVLDGCEHVIADAATFADMLLRRCPKLRILATSRQPLQIADERTYRLPALGVPAPGEATRLSATSAQRFASVALFAERARAKDHGFSINDENAPAVAEICRRLDGIPLAIELAAARINMVSVHTLLKRLDKRFQILASGDPSVLPRHHRSLGALLDWSYDRLSPPEQRLFERLSVFDGGCDLAMVATVCADENDDHEVLFVLSSLIDKSLAVADVHACEARYRLLESTRQYAHAKLQTRGESALVARRHAIAYLRLAERLERSCDLNPGHGSNLDDAAENLNRAKDELGNWHAALKWALLARGDILLGQRLASTLRPMWMNLSVAEGERWVSAALEAVDQTTPPGMLAQLESARADLALRHVGSASRASAAPAAMPTAR